MSDDDDFDFSDNEVQILSDSCGSSMQPQPRETRSSRARRSTNHYLTKDLDEERAAMYRKLKKTESQLEEADRELDDARSSRDRANNFSAQRLEKIITLERELEQTKEELTKASGALNEVKIQRERIVALEELVKKGDQDSIALQKSQASLSNVRSDLKNAQATDAARTKRITELEKALKDAKEERSALDTKHRVTETRIAGITMERDQAQELSTTLRKEIESLKTKLTEHETCLRTFEADAEKRSRLNMAEYVCTVQERDALNDALENGDLSVEELRHVLVTMRNFLKEKVRREQKLPRSYDSVMGVMVGSSLSKKEEVEKRGLEELPTQDGGSKRRKVDKSCGVA